MNHDYILELIDKNRSGLLIKLIKENIHRWSHNDFKKIMYITTKYNILNDNIIEFMYIHLTKQLTNFTYDFTDCGKIRNLYILKSYMLFKPEFNHEQFDETCNVLYRICIYTNPILLKYLTSYVTLKILSQFKYFNITNILEHKTDYCSTKTIAYIINNYSLFGVGAFKYNRYLHMTDNELQSDYYDFVLSQVRIPDNETLLCVKIIKLMSLHTYEYIIELPFYKNSATAQLLIAIAFNKINHLKTLSNTIEITEPLFDTLHILIGKYCNHDTFYYILNNYIKVKHSILSLIDRVLFIASTTGNTQLIIYILQNTEHDIDEMKYVLMALIDDCNYQCIQYPLFHKIINEQMKYNSFEILSCLINRYLQLHDYTLYNGHNAHHDKLMESLQRILSHILSENILQNSRTKSGHKHVITSFEYDISHILNL